MVTNGAIPLARMSKVDATHYAAPGCAAAFRAWSVRMVALGYPALTAGNAADSCYRSLAWQRYRWNHQPPLAAYPGTSNHGYGMAIDIGNYYRYPHSVLVREGRRYGFVFDTPSELWHVRYLGAAKYKTVAPAGGGTRPLPSTAGTKEKIMARVIRDDNKAATKYRHAVTDFGFTFDFIVGDSAQQKTRVERKVRLIGLPVLGCSPGEFQAELDDVNANRREAGLPDIVRPT